MPQLTIGGKTVSVAEDTRLVNAIEDAGVPIGHRCGGHGRCTTCRVSFSAGEPTTMTAAEYEKLKERELLGSYRLSCQIICDHDMICEAEMTMDNQEWSDAGSRPADTVEPIAEWMERSVFGA